MSLPVERVLNRRLTEAFGRDVVKMEVLPIAAGQTAQVRFLETASAWRQGIWIGTEGLLEVAGARDSQLILWTDTAPSEVRVFVIETDGWLRFYNIWDSGRGLSPYESHSATSGMLVSGLRYACSDIAEDPEFDRLSFSLEVVGP
jgi:hypothetical protein